MLCTTLCRDFFSFSCFFSLFWFLFPQRIHPLEYRLTGRGERVVDKIYIYIEREKKKEGVIFEQRHFSWILTTSNLCWRGAGQRKESYLGL